ncbi:F-box/FBD/LRR-repeat protein-like isoform X1 [Salvia divinorum]|uniref:F-box/FBD/LRR-repeat protein-like isoform X1 n=1 Tax=Salvia divinorum TaxID=28513 RepID=A0ABD1IQB0_SALDI
MIEMEWDPGCVSISDFPDSIIEIILTKLPIMDAVRTCVLSKRWRHRWASMTNLVFDDRMFDDTWVVEYDQIVQFIDKCLRLHHGPIHVFSIESVNICVAPEVEEWLFILSKTLVKELILVFSDASWCTVPQSLFCFKNLTRLKLSQWELRPPPDFNGFKLLKRIDFVLVMFPQNDYGRLIESCPLLETLMISSHESIALTIRAPNLKSLDVYGEFLELCLAHTPLLVSAWMDIYTSVEHTSNCLHKFLGCTPKLEKLVWEVRQVKVGVLGIGHGHRPVTYDHLKYIDLHNVNFKDYKEVLVVLQVIVNSPVLKKLKIYVSDVPDTNIDPEHLIFWHNHTFDDYTLHQLKTVKLSGVSDMPVEMGFIKFLVEHSPSLEVMRIRPKKCKEDQTDPLLPMQIALASWQRASPQASINFKL